jgi:hypothetical protein
LAEQSADVVRSYLRALARGDDASARVTLDPRSDIHDKEFDEKQCLGTDVRFPRLVATDSGADVNVDIDVATERNACTIQYGLKKNSHGAVMIFKRSVTTH